MTQDARLWAQDSLRHSLAAFAMYACIHGAQILGVVTKSVSQSANPDGLKSPGKKAPPVSFNEWPSGSCFRECCTAVCATRCFARPGDPDMDN